MAKPTKLTQKNKEAFLRCLSEGKSVTFAANAIGVDRSQVYQWQHANPDFKAEWESALQAGTDKLEDEAWRRAHDGVDEPVFYQGQTCGVIRRYSDTLLIFTLKARRPEKFRDNVNISADDGQLDALADAFNRSRRTVNAAVTVLTEGN